MISSTSSKKALPQKSGHSSRKKIAAVDAVVASHPNLNLKLKLQNLFNFFIECLTKISFNNNDLAKHEEYLSKCLKFIDSEFKKNEDIFSGDTLSVFIEFMENARQLFNLLKAFSESDSNHPVDILLAAKASHLQWLAVCILEDLKTPLTIK